MADKQVTIAHSIECGINGISACSKDVADYINNQVPKLLDSYTCTDSPILEKVFLQDVVTTGSILVLCSGVLKQSP